MRGKKPGFWKNYERCQFKIAVASMPNTKFSDSRPVPHVRSKNQPSGPISPTFHVVGPVIGRLGGALVIRG